MKKIVPFKKEINLKTMISKISSISLEHTLKVNDGNTINGHFIVEGKYKMTQASQIDEQFSYKIPVEIEIDSKYDTSKIEFDIDEFTYEIIENDKVLLNISLSIDKLEEKEEIIDMVSIEKDFNQLESNNAISDESLDRLDDTLDNLFLETTEEEELVIPEENEENDILNNNMDMTNNTKNFNMENKTYTKEETMHNIQDMNDNNEMDSLFSSFKDSVETFKTYSVYIVKEEDTINSILVKYNIDKDSLEEYNDLSNITSGSKLIIPCGKNE